MATSLPAKSEDKEEVRWVRPHCDSGSPSKHDATFIFSDNVLRTHLTLYTICLQ